MYSTFHKTCFIHLNTEYNSTLHGNNLTLWRQTWIFSNVIKKDSVIFKCTTQLLQIFYCFVSQSMSNMNSIQPKQICWRFSARSDSALKALILSSVLLGDLNVRRQPLKQIWANQTSKQLSICIEWAWIQLTKLVTEYFLQTHQIKG